MVNNIFLDFVSNLFVNFPAAPKLNVPPRFRDTAYFDKGENVVVKIPFTGHPVPKITWVREGETIESGLHYHVERKGKLIGLYVEFI